MPQDQKVITPLVESAIQVEPATPPSMGINTRIQRAWSMLFGRRENTLQPIYASRGGMLGVVALDLNGWRKVYGATPPDDESWADMGEIVDLVIYGGLDDGIAVSVMFFGMVTGTAIYAHIPQNVVPTFFLGGDKISTSGVFHGRCRWYQGANLFGMDGYVIGYVAPDR